MNINYRDAAFIFLIILVVALSVYVFNYTKSEGYECISNSLVYGASKLSSTNNEPITCSCSFYGASQVLKFNKTSSWTENIYSSNQFWLPPK